MNVGRLKKVDQNLQQFVESNREELVERWFAKLSDITDVEQLSALSEEAINRYNQEFFNVILSGIHDSVDQQKKLVQDFAEKMGQLGWPLAYLTRGIQNFKGVLLDLFLLKGDRDKYPEFARALDESLNPIGEQLASQYREYTASWQKTVNVQRLALRELSAPLIPVFEKISVMPLIGTIDTERAKLIMENLLQGVIKHEAQVVLIDITGVPVVDTMVAHHIIQAAEAVRLVGAKCILVGIRPEIAQTIVNLGIDLTEIPTLSTLRKGIHSALQITGRKIVDVESS